VDFHLTLPDKTPVWQEIRQKFPTLSLIVNTKNDMERQQALSFGARHAWDRLNEKPEVLFGMITSLVLRKCFARSWAYYAGSILNGLVGMRHSLDETITAKQAGAVREEVVSLRTFLQALRGDAVEVTLEKDRPREIYFGPQGGIENKVRARWNNDAWRRLREEVVSSAALVKLEADLERIEAALTEVSPQQTENVQQLLEGLKPFVHAEEGVLARAAGAAGSLGPAGKRTTQNIPLKQKTQSIPLPALPPGEPAAKAPSRPTAPDAGN